MQELVHLGLLFSRRFTVRSAACLWTLLTVGAAHGGRCSRIHGARRRALAAPRRCRAEGRLQRCRGLALLTTGRECEGARRE